MYGRYPPHPPGCQTSGSQQYREVEALVSRGRSGRYTGRCENLSVVAAQPTGTVTFLFTDIEGSTRLWDEHPESMADALERHDAICRSAIADHGGVVFSTGGDGFAVAFQRASDGVAAAVDIQIALGEARWPLSTGLRVRMALHTGEARERDGDYFGPPVNRAARLMAAGHGGQILTSVVTAELAEEVPGIDLVELGTHHLRGIAEPVRVLGMRIDGVPGIDRPLTTVEGARGNLPAVLDDFVGRGSEQRDLAGELRSRGVLTITGSGGVGKTRLAIEVAGATSDEFSDGVWFVELAAVSDPLAVQQLVATTLDVRQEAGVSPLELIVSVLRTQRALLILDNAEHVVAAVAEIATAVAERCSMSRVLVTSREPLGVRGEHVHALSSLGEGEGFELFCDRARALDDGFSVDEDDHETIDAICRRLDGIPLAIELAAARTRSLTPRDMLARLDDRFRLLRGGRGGVDRHQTLRAALSWSYQLLTEQERLLFDRCSVFAGGFALADAEQVCGFGALDAADVLDVLGSLVDKSMIVTDRHDRSVRFRLLETIRQYGGEQLTERQETADLRDRHLDHYLSGARHIAALSQGPDELEGARRFALDFDNFRGAFDWAWGASDLERAIGIATALWPIGNLNSEVVEWVELVRGATPAGHPAADGLELFTAFGRIIAGDSAAVIDGLVGLANRSDLPDSLRSTAWTFLATAYLNTGDADLGLVAVRKAMELADDDPAARDLSARVGCWCAWAREPQAVAGFAATISQVAELTGRPSTQSWAHFCLGVADLVEGRVESARANFTVSLRLVKGTNGMAEVQALQGLAAVAAASNDPAEVAVAFGEALRRLHRIQFWMYIWIVLENLAVYWVSSGDHEGGAVLLGHLEAHDHAHGVFTGERRRSLALLADDRLSVEPMQRGAAMTRDELVAYAEDRLSGPTLLR